MKIIQIVAAYKPAYIYGGPTMSVAKLCEALQKEQKDQSLKTKDQEAKNDYFEKIPPPTPPTNRSKRSKGGHSVEQTEQAELKDQSLKTKVQGAKNDYFAKIPPPTPSKGGHSVEHTQHEELKDQSLKTKVQGAKNDYFEKIPPPTPSKGGQSIASNNEIVLEVFTTTANGKRELDVKPNEQIVVNGVLVTYFKRITKDHTHFSPPLLWALRKEILSHSLCKNNLNLSPPPTPPTNRSKRSKGGHDLIFHIHAWWNLVSIFSCFIAKWYKIPVLLSPRGMLTSYTTNNRNSFPKKIIHQLIGRKLLKYCHIHATSEHEKEEVLNFIQPKSITVIPNLVELEAPPNLPIREELNNLKKANDLPIHEKSSTYNDRGVQSIHLCNQPQSEAAGFKMIFLSRIEQKKGLELLFNALAELTIDWSLTIAGTGAEKYLNSLKAKAERLKINEQIKWLGQVNNEDKFNLLANHDLMVLTSYNENFANVVIESLSVGTPVLLSENVGLADYVLRKNFGWIANLDKENIVNNLNNCFIDSEKRQKIRLEAPAIIRENFNDQTLVKKYIELYENLTNGNL